MKTLTVVAAILVWSLFLGVGGFALGYMIRDGAEAKKEVKTLDKEQKLKARKDGKALAAGLRTEQAQAASDTAFQNIRSDYEIDKHQTPGIGCVLDPVSLRRWNEANAQSGDAAAGEPAGEVQGAAEAEGGGGRGE